MRSLALTLGVVLAALTLASGANAASGWSLVPQPALAQPAPGGAVTVKGGDCVALRDVGDARVRAAVAALLERVQQARGLALHACASGATPRVVFRMDPNAEVQGDAGYRIVIGNDRIEVSARAPRGLFYGGVTLWQLLTPNGDRGAPVVVADGTIVDHPRFAWRGLMLDSARHFQSVGDIKQLIDWMSLVKLDVLHWHLTDDQGWRLEVPGYPELTKVGACRKAVGPDAALTGGPDKPYCGFYTEAEIRGIVQYAAARFVTIVPEIDMPGHAQAAIAAYPWLGATGKRSEVSTDWGVNTWLLNPADPRTFRFVDAVLDEVMQLFPSKYIHIGGDEAAKDQWEASPEVVAQMHQLGLANMDALQGWFMGKVADYLAAHGRTAVGWDEILGGKLPKSAVVMSWRGVAGAIEAADRGHDTVLSPSPVMYLDHVQSSAHDQPPSRPEVESLKDVYAFEPVPARLTAEQAHHVLGLQGNLWAEYMPTFARAQHAIFPRMAAWSEVAWSPASAINWTSFLERMPAEIARYRMLDVAYADAAWAPRFKLAAQDGRISVALSNQVGYGQIRYTTDGRAPTASSTLYARALEFPADATTELQAATFTAAGAPLAAVRSRTINAQALLTRNSDQLETCSTEGGIALRIEDDRPLEGPRPVYKVDIANTCWIWSDAPLDGVDDVAIRVGNLPWNYALWTSTKDVIARPEATPDGELDVHLDICNGPTIATLPLAPATKTALTTVLQARLPRLRGSHSLCFIATGDPRKGTIWAIDTVKLTPATAIAR
jgi:hexosaminidase